MIDDNSITWLFGIEKYFHFQRRFDQELFIRSLINLKYSDQINKPWKLRDLITLDYSLYPTDSREHRTNIYTKLCVENNITTQEVVYLLSSIWPTDALISKLHHMVALNQGELLATVFSKGQVFSKIWMSEILSKFDLKFDSIILIGGWLAHHTLYLNDVKFTELYSIDPDSSINELIEIVNPGAIVVNKQINECFDFANNITIYGKTILPSLVINTSAEHMDNTWYEKLAPGTKVFIESNDYDIPEHINWCTNLENFAAKYPMQTVYYRGELALSKYKRFALYGIK